MSDPTDPAPREPDLAAMIIFLHGQMGLAVRQVGEAQRTYRDSQAERWRGYRRGLGDIKDRMFDGDRHDWPERVARFIQERVDSTSTAEPDGRGYVAALTDVRDHRAAWPDARPETRFPAVCATMDDKEQHRRLIMQTRPHTYTRIRPRGPEKVMLLAHGDGQDGHHRWTVELDGEVVKGFLVTCADLNHGERDHRGRDRDPHYRFGAVAPWGATSSINGGKTLTEGLDWICRWIIDETVYEAERKQRQHRDGTPATEAS